MPEHLGQSGGRTCGVKRCRREATQAFDLYDPWKAHGVFWSGDEDRRHYEVCDKHAAEFWPELGYVEKERAEAIRRRVVPC